ncbi:MAG: hypothetical protein AAGM22_19230 [Acidobacteriota bacterium]
MSFPSAALIARQRQSPTTPQALASRSCRSGCAGRRKTESEPSSDGASAAVPSLVAPRYSIRVPETPTKVLCCLCGSAFTAAGPTGHVNDQPVCDLCMLERSLQLGLVLALVAVTRSYGGGWPVDEVEEDHARFELMAFARLYDAKASAFAPARPVDPDWMWPDAGT